MRNSTLAKVDLNIRKKIDEEVRACPSGSIVDGFCKQLPRTFVDLFVCPASFIWRKQSIRLQYHLVVYGFVQNCGLNVPQRDTSLAGYLR